MNIDMIHVDGFMRCDGGNAAEHSYCRVYYYLSAIYAVRTSYTLHIHTHSIFRCILSRINKYMLETIFTNRFVFSGRL